uniref:DNA topoisomerase (ATP-hydrolyzing) n=1 Tax=Ascaris suum TaxID=6253 RepID=F1KYQ9_ASCSU
MVMTDQDEDGAHIRGLIINFLHSFWPSLIRSDFIQYFVTPLLKARRGSEVISFYSNSEFEKWKRDFPNSKKYSIKYYKGLGTSSAEEAREYFAEMDRHRVQFVYGGEEDDESIRLAFDKSRADDRKIWIAHTSENTDSRKRENLNQRTYSEFINEELIDFSRLDIRRSVPNAIDGLKPSQRKVLYTLMQRFEKSEVRVVQLAGAVAHSCAYHHGEEPLINTIVRLAQDFVGSNNLNLLQPIGQFGTRLIGGEDCASARYIYTALSPLVRWIFPRADDSVLSYIEEDNMRIEPQWFCPIIPMVLVNGAEGIGTGWATKVLCYNPKQVIRNVQRMIDGQPLQKMVPFYRNFTGTIKEASEGRFHISGTVTLRPSRKNAHFIQAEITELPVGVWTQRYKEKVLDVLAKSGIISGYKELHTENAVRFLLELPKGSGIWSSANGGRKHALHKTLKLDTVLGTSSMVLFDENNSLRRFTRIEEIFELFFEVRRQKYIERRDHQIGVLDAKLRFYENQCRFVEAVLNKEITIEGKSRTDIESTLRQRHFEPNPLKAPNHEDGNELNKSEFSYLLDMPIIRLSNEEVKSLIESRDAKVTEMNMLKGKDWKDMWHEDLRNLTVQLEKDEKKRER